MPTKAAMPPFTLSPALVAMTLIVTNVPATPKWPISTTTISYDKSKTLGRPALCTPNQLTPISPPHSDWSDEDWDRERQRERDRKEKEWVEKQDSVQKDPETYYPPSHIYMSPATTVRLPQPLLTH